MKEYKFKIGGKDYAVKIGEANGRNLTVNVNGADYQVELSETPDQVGGDAPGLTHAEDWKLETEGWSLWGSSAGGHLVASFCTEEWDTPKPAALLLIYPVVTMGEHTHIQSRENLLGKKPDPQMIERLSVEKHISSGFPPTFVWNGKADTLVDPINSRMLETALERAGIPHLAEEYEGIEHGAGLALGTNAEPWFEHAVAFWEQQRSKR